jgi:hypothetical protein
MDIFKKKFKIHFESISTSLESSKSLRLLIPHSNFEETSFWEAILSFFCQFLNAYAQKTVHTFSDNLQKVKTNFLAHSVSFSVLILLKLKKI